MSHLPIYGSWHAFTVAPFLSVPATMLAATGLPAAEVRLNTQSLSAFFSCSKHIKSPQHARTSSRRCRLTVDAKKKGRPAARAAEVEAEKPAGVQEQSDAASPVASEPIADTVASTSDSEETAVQVSATARPQKLCMEVLVDHSLLDKRELAAVQEVQMSISEEDLKTLKAAIRNKQTGDRQETGLLEVRKGVAAAHIP